MAEDIISEHLTRKQIAARRNGRLGGVAKAANYWAKIWATQPSPRQVAGRINGQKGGWATARKYGGGFCRLRAHKGGIAVLKKYGPEHFGRLRQLQQERRRNAEAY